MLELRDHVGQLSSRDAEVQDLDGQRCSTREVRFDLSGDRIRRVHREAIGERVAEHHDAKAVGRLVTRQRRPPKSKAVHLLHDRRKRELHARIHDAHAGLQAEAPPIPRCLHVEPGDREVAPDLSQADLADAEGDEAGGHDDAQLSPKPDRRPFVFHAMHPATISGHRGPFGRPGFGTSVGFQPTSNPREASIAACSPARRCRASARQAR